MLYPIMLLAHDGKAKLPSGSLEEPGHVRVSRVARTDCLSTVISGILADNWRPLFRRVMEFKPL